MKYMFASDIHGDAVCCQEMLERFDAAGADKLILLGDLLYHGPRNDLPRDYDPKKVTALLNARKRDLLCVRGNCDAEVDQMVLEFPIMADYMTIYDGDRLFFVTHGHLYNLDHLPVCSGPYALIHGHTHVQTVTPFPEGVYLNPGSVTMPKEGNPRSYMLYEDGLFRILDMDGKELNRYQL